MHMHARLEMQGHYKQLFISLPFKSIRLRSAAKGTNSNCFPLNTLDRRVRLGSDNDFPRCSPSLLYPHPTPSSHPPSPVPPIPTRLHLCLRWGFWLVLVWLMADRLHLAFHCLQSLCPNQRANTIWSHRKKQNKTKQKQLWGNFQLQRAHTNTS